MHSENIWNSVYFLYLLYYSESMATKYHVPSKLLLVVKLTGETCNYFGCLWDAILANFAEHWFLILMLSSYTDIEIPYIDIVTLILILKSLYWNHLQLILWKCAVFTCFYNVILILWKYVCSLFFPAKLGLSFLPYVKNGPF